MLVFKKVILFLLVGCFIFMCSGCVSGTRVDCAPHEEISTFKLVSATDTTTVNGMISGGGCIVWHVSGSASETPIYRYYYELDDGGIQLGTIPAKSTTLYYIEDGKEPYIEIIKTRDCSGYYTGNPERHFLDTVFHMTYKLYVPEGSILNVFQFDGS